MNYENLENLNVRFRTLGCYPLTACIKSNAKKIEEIINELEYSDYSERAGRLIYQLDSDSMEKKKKEGYFKMSSDIFKVVFVEVLMMEKVHY